MISITHKSIFIHIPKTAGQSIEEAFLQDLAPTLRWSIHRHLLLCLGKPKGWPNTMPDKLAHLTANEYVEYKLLPLSIFNDFYKFSVVRDPVDRVVSMWRYNHLDISFSEFVHNYLPQAIDTYQNRPQWNYLSNSENELIVDDVFYFDQLSEAWKIICERSGVSTHLGHRNKRRSDRDPGLDKNMVEQIETLYAIDYEKFEFEKYSIDLKTGGINPVSVQM